MRAAISGAVLIQVLLSARPVAAYCYYDSFGRYRCTYDGLSYGARVGISIGCLVLSILLISLCILQRKRRARAQNVMLLQAQQHPFGGPPPPGGFQQQPPYGTPYGGPHNGFGGPQPFQPGYQGGYLNNGAPPMHPEAKGFAPGGTPGVAEPPRSYNPDQPYVPPPGAPNTTGPAEPQLPQYTGYSPPAGPPPGQAAGTNNFYNYQPPEPAKS